MPFIFCRDKCDAEQNKKKKICICIYTVVRRFREALIQLSTLKKWILMSVQISGHEADTINIHTPSEEQSNEPMILNRNVSTKVNLSYHSNNWPDEKVIEYYVAAILSFVENIQFIYSKEIHQFAPEQKQIAFIFIFFFLFCMRRDVCSISHLHAWAMTWMKIATTR